MPELFPLHACESAPTGSRASLEVAERVFGRVPNLLGVMTTSPALVQGYLSLSAIFDQHSSLSPSECRSYC